MHFDIVHAIWSGWCGLVAVTAGRILGVPSLIHVAGGELVSIPEIGYGGRLRWHGRLREALTLRAASAVTAASAPVIAKLSELGLAAQRVPLGVDLNAWPPREPVRRDEGRPARLIHVASSESGKGPINDASSTRVRSSGGSRVSRWISSAKIPYRARFSMRPPNWDCWKGLDSGVYAAPSAAAIRRGSRSHDRLVAS